MMRLFLVLALSASCAQAASLEANPIRKIVTLMQDMQKEIEAEGEKEKVLYDNFMCWCETGAADLKKGAETASAAIDEFSSKLEQETAEKSQIDQELIEHKADRESAKKDVDESTSLRNKEKEDYDAVAAESATNIKALSGALPALKKGLGGAALIQMAGASRLNKIIEHSLVLDSFDRESMTAFLQAKEGAPGSDQIVGIMEQMLEEMQKSSAEADADEAKAVASFNELTASKQKEIEVATGAIETKSVRSGELAVAIVQDQNGLDDAKEELADNQQQLASMTTTCAEKTKEFQVRSKLRAEEVAAISEAIAILNDDDALDVFKKAVPASSFVQSGSVGFLQAKQGKASALTKAQTILSAAALKFDSKPLALISFSMRSKIKLAAKTGVKAQNFGMIMNMIDNMVKILGEEQDEDDKHKEYCEAEFDKSGDEEKATTDKIASLDATVTELTDSAATLKEDIATLTGEIKELDKSVAQATAQRKAEHAEYTTNAALNEAANALLEKAKQRLNKFYNPTLYKAPPKKELSMEDSLYVKAGREEFAGLVQIRSHSRVAQAPEVFSGIQQPKREKSTGVIALMNMMQSDLQSDMKDAEADEKMAQKEYEDLMTESAATRAQNAKSITTKEAAAAELEGKTQEAKESKVLATETLEDVRLTINHLHTSCDFLMENYDTRKEARDNELESLKNGKSVLAGADMS